MGDVLGQLLPYAIGVAISPVPLIAVILLLLAPRAGGASAGFLIGWLAGIVVITTVSALLAGSADPSDDGPAPVVGWIKLLVGVVLLGMAVSQFRRRPEPGEEPALPGWMAAIDEVTPRRAVGLGAALSAINPKNLGLGLAAGSTIGGADLSAGQVVVAVAAYTLLAASTVAVPVLAYAVAAERMREPLDALRDWLVRENSVIMGTLQTVLGVVLLGHGIAGVTG